MKFSRKTDYGIILLKALAPSFVKRDFYSVSRISEIHRLPAAFTEKLAVKLSQVGFLEARRGVQGGYRLVKDPKKITLREIIDVFEEPPMMRCMQSSHPEKLCPLVSVCPAHKTWAEVDKKVNKIFKKITLAGL